MWMDKTDHQARIKLLFSQSIHNTSFVRKDKKKKQQQKKQELVSEFIHCL